MSLFDFFVLLSQIWRFMLDIFSNVWQLYTTVPVLMAVLGLWLLDRIFHIFDFIKG